MCYYEKANTSPIIGMNMAVACNTTDTTETQTKLSDTLSSVQESQKNISTKITYHTDILNEQQRNRVEQTITSYLSFFNINIEEITIAEDVVRKKQQTESGETSTVAYAEPGVIYINPDFCSNNDEKKRKNTIIHELFHCIKSKTWMAILPYVLKHWSTMTGFNGLSILVQSKWEDTKFVLLEEAAAEACAVKYDQNYSVEDVYYANLGSLMLKMMYKWWITTDDLIKAQQTNDVYFLISKIIGKVPDNKDLEIIMWCFNDVYMTDQDITEQALKTIENIRNE